MLYVNRTFYECPSPLFKTSLISPGAISFSVSFSRKLKLAQTQKQKSSIASWTRQFPYVHHKQRKALIIRFFPAFGFK